MNKNYYILLAIVIISILLIISISPSCDGKSGKKSREGLVTSCNWTVKNIGGALSGTTVSLDLPTCPLPTSIDCTLSSTYTMIKNWYDQHYAGTARGNFIMSSLIGIKQVDPFTCDVAYNWTSSTASPNSGRDSRRFTLGVPEKSYPLTLCSDSSVNGGTDLQKCQNWCKGCGIAIDRSELSGTALTQYNNICGNFVTGNCDPKV
jgi:hypothetical protein